MKSIKGSQTEKNLLKAFAGESQARNRYSYFSNKAKDEGYVQISAIFEETATQERSHAKRFFKFLEGGELEITASFPAGMIGTTLDNLLAAADGEQHEHTVLYPEFAKTARAEGFPQVAVAFDTISVAEKFHERRYRELAANIQAGTVFKKDNVIIWVCRHCGFLHEGTEALLTCPACLHPQAHFEVLAQNW